MTQERVVILKIQSIAESKGTTLANVAKGVGADRETLTAWIKGTNIPTEEQMEKICEMLETSKEEIFEGSGLTPVNKTATKAPVKEKKEAPAKRKTAKKEKADTEPKIKYAASAGPGSAGKRDEAVKEEPKEKTVQTKEDPATISKEFESKISALFGEKPKRKRKTEEPDETAKQLREALGLKKTAPLTETSIREAREGALKRISDELDKLNASTDVLVKAYCTEKPAVSERYSKLLAAAEKASDEGIELAIKILNKWC